MFSTTHMEKTDQGYRLPEKIRRDSYANYLLEGQKSFTNVFSEISEKRKCFYTLAPGIKLDT